MYCARFSQTMAPQLFKAQRENPCVSLCVFSMVLCGLYLIFKWYELFNENKSAARAALLFKCTKRLKTFLVSKHYLAAIPVAPSGNPLTV
jgi:hypothetical protein